MRVVSGGQNGSGLKLKVPVLNIEGMRVPMGGPIVDNVTKFRKRGSSEQQRVVQIHINNLISFDGISVRSLDIGNVRTALTRKGHGKVSLKQAGEAKEFAGDVVKKVATTTLELLGLDGVAGVMEIVKSLAQKVRSNIQLTPDEETEFRAMMQLGDESLGFAHAISRKFNTLESPPTDSGVNYGDQHVGLPSILTTTMLEFPGGVNSNLSVRTNIPLFGLGRDHGKDCVAHSTTHVTLDNKPVHTSEKSLPLGTYEFKTVGQA